MLSLSGKPTFQVSFILTLDSNWSVPAEFADELATAINQFNAEPLFKELGTPRKSRL
jgi:hypothetical protein